MAKAAEKERVDDAKASCYPEGTIKDGKIAKRNKAKKMYWSKFVDGETKGTKKATTKKTSATTAKKATSAATTKKAPSAAKKVSAATKKKPTATKKTTASKGEGAKKAGSYHLLLIQKSLPATYKINNVHTMMRIIAERATPKDAIVMKNLNNVAGSLGVALRDRPNNKRNVESLQRKLFTETDKVESHETRYSKDGPLIKIESEVVQGTL